MRTGRRGPSDEQEAERRGSFKAAVVQAAPVAFDLERSLNKVHLLAADAAARGARLVLFPEAFLSGYPRGLDFGAVVGSRSEEGRADFLRYWESSVDVPGPAVDRLSITARELDIYLVIGVVEREGGTLYCTVLFFAPDGTLMGKHRKVMPTGSERLVWGFGDGSTMPVFDTELGKLGAMICWENYLPLMRRPCMRRASRSTARQRQTPAIPGWHRCAILRLRDAASCFRATSSTGGEIFLPTIAPNSATIQMW